MKIIIRKMCLIIYGLTAFVGAAICAHPAMGAPAAMVEKHIFSPEAVTEDVKGDKKSPVVAELEKEYVFTGVISTDKERYAMIREKASKRETQGKKLYKVGDEINGMPVKEIGSNFIILAAKGENVYLSLYSNNKNRPSSPSVDIRQPVSSTTDIKTALSASSSQTQENQRKSEGTTHTASGRTQGTRQQKSATGATETGTEGAKKKQSNPFMDALKKAVEKREQRGTAGSPATNPFLEAIKKARQGK